MWKDTQELDESHYAVPHRCVHIIILRIIIDLYQSVFMSAYFCCGFAAQSGDVCGFAGQKIIFAALYTVVVCHE